VDKRTTFTWGDTVVVAASAPPDMRPGDKGWVVGMIERPEGTEYTVEFGDGSSVEIPESRLTAGDIPRR
jgi:hypothetical protein